MKVFHSLICAFAALLCAAISSGATDVQSDASWNPENAYAGSPKTSINISVEKDDVPDMGMVPTLILQSDQTDYEVALIELGRIPAVPGQKYRAVYYVMAQVEEPTDGLYLMIREYGSSQGGNPLNKEYHTLSSSVRSIPGKDIGRWVKKEFDFTPGEGAEFLSGALAVRLFKGRIIISPVQLLPGEDTDAPSADSKKKL